MTTDPKKFTTNWLVLMVFSGALFGAAAYHLFIPKEPCPPCPDPPGMKWISCFDMKNMESMIRATDAWGVRFYTAKGSGGELTVLAAPIKDDGSHIPDVTGTLNFRVYKAMVDATTDVILMDEPNAERAVKDIIGIDREPWSIDVKGDLLVRQLGTDGANGIGIVERRTAEGNRTFELAPVKIASGAATMAGTVDDILVGSGPCPLHCPSEPAMYLHLRRE